MKKKVKRLPTTSEVMRQGGGPKAVHTPVGDLEEIMGQGHSPKAKVPLGRDALRKIMHQ